MSLLWHEIQMMLFKQMITKVQDARKGCVSHSWRNDLICGFSCIWLEQYCCELAYCLSAEKASPVKIEQKVIDGKAHAALFDPLQSVKNEADTTNTTDASGDPFANIGEKLLITVL